MIHYRFFHNTDPPHLARIWRRQSPLRGRAPGISATRLEELVLSKPYFDPHGLILAVDDEQPIGFVHAGFGPRDDLSGLSRQQGVISMLLVEDRPERTEIATELLRQAEQYLRDAHADAITAIGVGSLCPYYLGLYGGSRLPGVLEGDQSTRDVFKNAGYEPRDHVVVMHRDLSSFRPLTDRNQVQIRRSTQVEMVDDPPARSWWEACTLGPFEQIAVQMVPKDCGPAWGTARFWCMGPLGQAWGVNAVGLIDIEVSAERRGAGVATCLLGEALRPLGQRGVSLVETQVPESNAPALRLLQRLGFTQVDTGTVLVKNSNAH